MDVAVQGGKDARVAAPFASVSKEVVMPRTLRDAGARRYPHAVSAGGEGLGSVFAGESLSNTPDRVSFRSGVTTLVDADGWGWRNFAESKRRIIHRETNYPKARVLASYAVLDRPITGESAPDFI